MSTKTSITTEMICFKNYVSLITINLENVVESSNTKQGYYKDSETFFQNLNFDLHTEDKSLCIVLVH